MKGLEEAQFDGKALAQLMRSRRTVHSYRKAEPDRSLIERALELALWSPNHRSTAPWRFVWVGSQTREKLAHLAVELKEKEGNLSEAKKKAVYQKILEPAALVVLGCLRDPDPLVERENYASVACGVQNASLYLWSQGLGTKWGTGALTRHPQVYKWMNLDPQKVEMVGFFWIGPFDSSPKPPPRPPLSQLLSEV